MENISEVTARVLQGPLLERLSNQTHESQSAIKRGVEQAVPISIAGIAAHAGSSEQKAQDLLGALRSGTLPHVDAGGIAQATENPEAATHLVQSGSTFLRGILGNNKMDTAVDTVAGRSGVSRATASTLLGLAAPVVLHALGKHAGDRNLDARGLSQYLTEQGQRASSELPASTAGLFGEAREGAQRAGQAAQGAAGEAREGAQRAGQAAQGAGGEAREGAQRAGQHARTSMNEARERLRETIEQRQHRGAQPAPGRRRFGTWIAVAAAVLLAILLLGRRSAPPHEVPVPGVGGGEQQQAAPAQPPANEQNQPNQQAAPNQGAPNEAAPQQAQPGAAQPGQQAQPGEQGQQAAQGNEQQAGQQQPSGEAAPGGMPAPATLSLTTGAAPLTAFLSGTDPTPKRFVLEGITFAPDSSDVSQNAMLDAVAAALNEHANARIRIDGYTDSTGTSAGNADLSDARANAVKRYIAARGVNESRIDAQGRAAEQPMGSNDTAAGRAENRRVELVVTSR
jgi:outer membrane protein OmpA-like peptidoglycan-associated protein